MQITTQIPTLPQRFRLRSPDLLVYPTVIGASHHTWRFSLPVPPTSGTTGFLPFHCSRPAVVAAIRSARVSLAAGLPTDIPDIHASPRCRAPYRSPWIPTHRHAMDTAIATRRIPEYRRTMMQTSRRCLTPLCEETDCGFPDVSKHLHVPVGFDLQERLLAVVRNRSDRRQTGHSSRHVVFASGP